ncbi:MULTISPECIES: hemin uptake protein HemP [Thalassospira]|nr:MULTISPECIES: hemin uptake protein HemP [Thalassospira]MDG4721386.1 hemin uptake protein HemP [Thalassospira sp. FZY0004]
MPDIAARTEKQSVATQAKHIQVEDLMGSDREVIIIHQGDEYRLRMTSNNKLILTK